MAVQQIQVGPPGGAAAIGPSLAPLSQPAMLGGATAEGIIAQLHGQHYTSARNGRVQWVTTATAGTTIPVQAASLVSTFTLWNPLGSGVNVELITYSLAFEAATTVVSEISLYFQVNVGTTVAVPGTLTALTIRNGLLGGGLASQCTAYSAATLTGAATLLLKGPTLMGATAVTSTQIGARYDFLGTILVPPGTIVTTAGNAAQASAASQTLIWSEYPV